MPEKNRTILPHMLQIVLMNSVRLEGNLLSLIIFPVSTQHWVSLNLLKRLSYQIHNAVVKKQADGTNCVLKWQ